jgi:hypothetical protein
MDRVLNPGGKKPVSNLASTPSGQILSKGRAKSSSVDACMGPIPQEETRALSLIGSSLLQPLPKITLASALTSTCLGSHQHCPRQPTISQHIYCLVPQAPCVLPCCPSSVPPALTSFIPGPALLTSILPFLAMCLASASLVQSRGISVTC